MRPAFCEAKLHDEGSLDLTVLVTLCGIFYSELHKFNNVSYKNREEVGKLGVICNGGAAEGKLGYYFMKPHGGV